MDALVLPATKAERSQNFIVVGGVDFWVGEASLGTANGTTIYTNCVPRADGACSIAIYRLLNTPMFNKSRPMAG
jgi:hypothetical protein